MWVFVIPYQNSDLYNEAVATLYSGPLFYKLFQADSHIGGLKYKTFISERHEICANSRLMLFKHASTAIVTA